MKVVAYGVILFFAAVLAIVTSWPHPRTSDDALVIVLFMGSSLIVIGLELVDIKKEIKK